MINVGDSENTKTISSRILKIASICCFSFILLFVVYGIVVSPKLDYFYEKAHIYDGEWIREYPDKTTASYKMPMSLSLEKDEAATFHTILPDTVEDGMYLMVHTGKSCTMFVDGREIFSFDNNISAIPGNITKAVLLPVPLAQEYAGKQLTMVLRDGKYERNSVNTAYIGTLMGILIVVAKAYALQFAMAVLLILASLATICIFALVERRNHHEAPLIYLAESVFMISAWVLLDSPFFQVVFSTYFYDGIASFMIVTTMGLPFLLYFDAITEYRKHKIFFTFETVSLLNFIVFTFLHLTGIQSYDKALVYVDLCLVVYILVVLGCTMHDYILLKNKGHKNVIIGLISFGVFSVLEIVVTIMSANMPFTVDIGGLCVLAGIILLLIFAILDQLSAFEILERQTQEAIAATRAKSDFLANMSHEIRTPINAIMGMNEMIMRESEQDNIKEYAKDISSASENLLGIVNDILDFSKIESGKLEIVCDNYDFGELIYDVTTLVNMRAEDKGLKFNVIVEPDLPFKLYGDDKRVREIITNILNNAVKYTAKGFVTLRVSGISEANAVILQISVEDSGQGIKPEDMDSIFEGFSQVNVKNNKHIEGTGLGLTITKRLIEMMSGSIKVESEFGKGSTFTVTLPQGIVSDEKMGNYLSHRHASAQGAGGKFKEPDLSNKNILVVDDTVLNQKVISKLLSKTKANISCVSSGLEMLDLIQKNEYDIILLDHMMPNMDGIEALKASKELENNKCKTTPVIALTANAIVGAKEMYLAAGFNDYLSKPVRMEEMCNMIVKYLKTDEDLNGKI